jgi:hypothetical protein
MSYLGSHLDTAQKAQHDQGEDNEMIGIVEALCWWVSQKKMLYQPTLLECRLGRAFFAKTNNLYVSNLLS